MMQIFVGVYVAIVDDEDYDRLNAIHWYPFKSRENWYARNREGEFMHQLVFWKDGIKRDHKNGNGLDNRKENLRPCNNQQNMANSKKRSGCICSFKGVTLRKERGTYRAQIRVNNKLIIIGTFDNEEQAARAYDKAAVEYFGEFARLNFPNE